MGHRFYSIYSHGFIRVAVCVPQVRVADPDYNAGQIVDLAQAASETGAAVALFPEMCVTAYSNDDLFHQSALLDAAESAVADILAASRSLSPVLLIGTPLRFENKLFNCAVAVYRGRVLGVTPKTYLPNYREYYEKRQFVPSGYALAGEISFLGETVPFGTDLIFSAENIPGFALNIEICEDIWTPVPPSTYAAMAGATVLANMSASNITVGKAEFRRDICSVHSAKCIAAYLYSAAGPGESTTDLAWDGYGMIHENGKLLAESERFSDTAQMITSDIDLERLAQDRMRMTSFNDCVAAHRERLEPMRKIGFEFVIPTGDVRLQREVERFPFVPAEAERRDERCYEAYNIQVHGLIKRLSAAGIEKVVIGVSGGLDSTHALIVAARAMDRLGLPGKNILAYTMPGFATSKTTRKNATALMNALGVTANEIDIRPSCIQMMKDIGHPFVDGKPVYDVTFENVQAGERTSHLFRLANLHGGLVIGTGDLSELALGWATYGVGDQMSHYNVNASVPKTLIQHLIRWVAGSEQFNTTASKVLLAILDTEISPELVPSEDNEKETPAQSTEAKIGPYELQDFNLFYISRYGFPPSKVAFLAHHAWRDASKGAWSDFIPPERRNAYDLPEIVKWLELFLYRFFKISQFKRTAIPNGPKVGAGSLSPRGDWRAPSDSEATVWLEELKRNVPVGGGD